MLRSGSDQARSPGSRGESPTRLCLLPTAYCLLPHIRAPAAAAGSGPRGPPCRRALRSLVAARAEAPRGRRRRGRGARQRGSWPRRRGRARRRARCGRHRSRDGRRDRARWPHRDSTWPWGPRRCRRPPRGAARRPWPGPCGPRRRALSAGLGRRRQVIVGPVVQRRVAGVLDRPGQVVRDRAVLVSELRIIVPQRPQPVAVVIHGAVGPLADPRSGLPAAWPSARSRRSRL